MYPHNSLYNKSNNINNINNNNSSSSTSSSPRNTNKSSKRHKNKSHNGALSDSSDTNNNESSSEEDNIELGLNQQDLSDDDDPNKFITDFDPSIQPLSHLLSMPASGEVKGIAMSPYNGIYSSLFILAQIIIYSYIFLMVATGDILVATSSRLFNQKSSLDILTIPHWTWNYSSTQRLPYKIQLREKYKLKQKLLQQQEENKNRNKNNNDNDNHELNLVINSLDDELDLDQQAEQQRNNPFIENQNANDDKIASDFVNRPSVIPLPYGARERCITFSPSPNIVFVGIDIFYFFPLFSILHLCVLCAFPLEHVLCALLLLIK